MSADWDFGSGKGPYDVLGLENGPERTPDDIKKVWSGLGGPGYGRIDMPQRVLGAAHALLAWLPRMPEACMLLHACSRWRTSWCHLADGCPQHAQTGARKQAHSV